MWPILSGIIEIRDIKKGLVQSRFPFIKHLLHMGFQMLHLLVAGKDPDALFGEKFGYAQLRLRLGQNLHLVFRMQQINNVSNGKR